MILDLVSSVTCMRKVEGNQKSVIQMEHKKAESFFLSSFCKCLNGKFVFIVPNIKYQYLEYGERETYCIKCLWYIYIGYVIHNSCMHQRREGWHKNYKKFSVFNWNILKFWFETCPCVELSLPIEDLFCLIK